MLDSVNEWLRDTPRIHLSENSQDPTVTTAELPALLKYIIITNTNLTGTINFTSFPEAMKEVFLVANRLHGISRSALTSPRT